jgi:RNA polymerase sigma-70 factor (ECF subfamily)
MDGSVVRHPPFSYLYRTHRAKALAIARRILGDKDEAEDVVQEVFAKLYAGRGKFDGKAAYSTWLYRILVNSSINQLRARRRRGRLQAHSAPPLTPEQEASGRELSRHFTRALGTLGERHQQVIWLREMRGFSYPEIAQLLGIPEGTVKSALNRGRLRLQRVVLAQSSLAPTN